MKVAVEICVAFLEQLSLMSRTHAAARSFAVACVQLEPRQTITRTKEWSGWQELNLRGHAPKAWGWPLPYTRIVGEGLSALPCLPLHADHLATSVHDVHQIALRFHHGVDGLVRHRGFVDDVRVLTALDAGCCLRVVIQCEAALRLRTRHGTSGSMTAAHETFRIALAAHDVRTRAHAAGNDSHVP